MLRPGLGGMGRRGFGMDDMGFGSLGLDMDLDGRMGLRTPG